MAKTMLNTSASTHAPLLRELGYQPMEPGKPVSLHHAGTSYTFEPLGDRDHDAPDPPCFSQFPIISNNIVGTLSIAVDLDEVMWIMVSEEPNFDFHTLLEAGFRDVSPRVKSYTH